MGLIRQFSSAVAGMVYRPTDAIADEYHRWYFGTLTWRTTSWMGVICWKSVSDMWNYQEILCELQPSLVVEFGSYRGGSALFFAGVMRQTGARSKCFRWTSPTNISTPKPPRTATLCSWSRRRPHLRWPTRSGNSESGVRVGCSPSSTATTPVSMYSPKWSHCGRCSRVGIIWWWRTPTSTATPSGRGPVRDRLRLLKRTRPNTPTTTSMIGGVSTSLGGRSPPTDFSYGNDGEPVGIGGGAVAPGGAEPDPALTVTRSAIPAGAPGPSSGAAWAPSWKSTPTGKRPHLTEWG